jgi:hypothetical protein
LIDDPESLSAYLQHKPSACAELDGAGVLQAEASAKES